VTVRPATPADLQRIVSLLRNAHAAAGFGDGTSPIQYPFVAQYAVRAFVSHLHDDNALCLVLDVGGVAQGMLLARAFDHELGPVRVAKETVWWIEPEHRGKAAGEMLQTYESWAAERGAAVVGMAALEAAPRAGAIYRHRGYQPTETHVLKALPV
jgi:GNAT superfamily N-acetyltransferase